MPASSEFISRKTALRQLRQAVSNFPLVVIAAPVGYGKTTLLLELKKKLSTPSLQAESPRHPLNRPIIEAADPDSDVLAPPMTGALGGAFSEDEDAIAQESARLCSLTGPISESPCSPGPFSGSLSGSLSGHLSPSGLSEGKPQGPDPWSSDLESPAREARETVVYMALSPGECSPEYLLARHKAALEEGPPSLRALVKRFPDPFALSSRPSLLEEARAICSLRPYVFILDDFHLSSDPRLGIFFERLAKEAIPGLTFILSGRSRPALPLEELRMKGLCRVFGIQALSFSQSEAAELFRREGVKESGPALAAWSACQGWPAGIRLQAQRLAETGRLAGDGEFRDIFSGAVFPLLGPEDRAFLGQLSLLPAFSPEQAVEVTGEAEAALRLSRLMDRGILASFSQEDGRFRLQPQFRAACRELLEGPGPEASFKPELFRRAAEVSNAQGDGASVCRFLSRAGRKEDLERLLSLFERPSFQREARSDREELAALAFLISPELRRLKPLGFIAYAFSCGLSLGREEGLSLLGLVKEDLSSGILSEPQKALSWLSLAEAALCHPQDHSLWPEREVCDFSGNGPDLALDFPWTLGSPQASFNFLTRSGQFQELTARAGRLWPGLMTLTRGWGQGGAALLEAERLLEGGDFAKAESLAQEAASEALSQGQGDVGAAAAFARLRAALAQKKMERALEILNRLPGGQEGRPQASLELEGDLARAYANATLRRPKLIPDWIVGGECPQPGEPFLMGPSYAQAVRGKALLAAGEHLQALGLARAMKQAFSSRPRVMGYLHALILEAACSWCLSGPEEAMAPLGQAMELSERDNLLLTVGEYGGHVTHLLRRLAQDSQNPFAERAYLLAKGYEDLGKLSLPEKVRLKKLTARERQILEQVMQGKNNGQIAEMLQIQRITVTKALSNAYRKLEVKNRAQAVKAFLSK